MDHALLKLYEHWRELSAAEAAGIQAGDWQKVERSQTSKQALQRQIDEQTHALRQSVDRADGDRCEVESSLKAILRELTELELRNRELLQARMRETRLVRDDLQRTTRNLRQIQHAYAMEPDEIWHSYS